MYIFIFFIVIFNLFDKQVSNVISKTNYYAIIENLKTLPEGLPEKYTDVIEIYEEEGGDVLTRQGFYKLCHDFPQIIEEPIKFQSALQQWYFDSIYICNNRCWK